MKKSFFIPLSILLILLAMVFYHQLGGFKSIVIEKKAFEELKLKGINFKGLPSDPALELAFKTVQDKANQDPFSPFYVIYHQEPAGKTDTLQVFVGLADDNKNTDPNWENLNFFQEAALFVELEIHPLVMPSPSKIKKELKKYAQSQQLLISEPFIEKIQGKNKITVIAPISK
jgi:hypothetical protein